MADGILGFNHLYGFHTKTGLSGLAVSESMRQSSIRGNNPSWSRVYRLPPMKSSPYRDSYDTYEPPQLFEHMNISLNLLCRRVRILQTWEGAIKMLEILYPLLEKLRTKTQIAPPRFNLQLRHGHRHSNNDVLGLSPKDYQEKQLYQRVHHAPLEVR
jgi:hypothetical protein